MGVELESSGNMALCCQRTDAEMSVCSASTEITYLPPRREDKKIISQFCRFGKDCDQNGDRMSENDEKLPYWH